jgi:hypothetical protein
VHLEAHASVHTRDPKVGTHAGLHAVASVAVTNSVVHVRVHVLAPLVGAYAGVQRGTK